MKRRERAVDDCAEDAAFSPSQAGGAGFSFNDGKERLGEMAKLAGFDFYLLSAFPRGDRTAFTENRLISNWPQSLVGFYEAADLFYCSRVVTAMKRTIVPIFCEEGAFAGSAANQENRRLNTLFQMQGLKNTFAFALHDADLKQYIFAFSGGCPMPAREQAMALLYGCMELLDKVSRNGSGEDGPSETLTRREIECMRWSAAGKSSDEIAIILDLSSHTVAGYLKSAMRKLDSVNRMQAVARAFRYRLL
ncbi:DNA-binding protein [Rhizobium ruizarguesonis]|uniref:helix-turn-helix transcriptional regulator n=1 Tax=Rhizobium ruizarguesonis TaxID=2081791 RepID=UPI001031E9D5|nr:LuxR C-terminal-related transcriptional regulator [Rhizobium ruizarguesonis]QIJ41844.1 DNA-binding protein [Rhizobium leguminosarum]NEH31288.1 DNA-binding protein [Rhizobium ruizarguesonis]NEJ07849.1 DNA-binding protein [Rhizobium ruizarguesonis]TAU11347.1 DNA-binding protein [Rhizobium ruizarguesonis]TAW78972.1 DNA-binding protein [Rhizobium ruizarguesonis]